MKNLILIFSILLSVSASAASRITAIITLTNTPSGHNNLVANGNTRLWTNSATANPGTLITIGASVGASATNLFNQLYAYPYSGITMSFSSSNVITLRGSVGQAVTVTASGTWATVALSTNTVLPQANVAVPLSSEQTQSKATNTASLLASDLGTYSTNAFATNTTLVSNLVQTDGDQTIAGTKSFTYETRFDAGFLVENTAPSIRMNESDAAVDEGTVTFTQDASSFRLNFVDDSSVSTSVIQFTRTGSTPTAMLITPPISASSLQDCVITNSSILDSILAYTNNIQGNWQWNRQNHTSLANGNNAGVDFPGYVFHKIKAGPSAAFAICGIAGGADGRELKLYNATGQDMTIPNDSGVEPTAANRIYTNTGATITITGNGFVHLIYDSEDSRWVVMNYQP